MKKSLALVALTLFGSVGAYATTMLTACSTWSVSAGVGTFGTGSPANTGFVTCPSVTVGSLPAGATFNSLQLVLQTDYSGGTLGSLNTIQTTYTSSAIVAGPGQDILTATSAPGTGGSQTYISADGATVYLPGGASYFIENTNLTTLPTGTFNVNFSSLVTAGTVQTESGQVYELITFTPATGGVPEPTTVSLMGAGLLGLGFARKFKKKV